MKPFLRQLEHERIERAIAAAERKTSGEIRVVIHPEAAPDALKVASEEFTRLGMRRTRHRNAVLIFIAPLSQTFAVFGDLAVHERCGDTFWQEVSEAMSKEFRAGAFTDGIVHAVERAGALLAAHFPRSPDDRNELPDTVVDRGIVI